MYDIQAKLSNYEVKKIIQCFCLDIDATKTTTLTKFNRNTVNKYFNYFRQAFYLHQILDREKFVGRIEMDESYFGSSRVRGYHGKLKRGRGTLKQPVFGIIQRRDEFGKLRVFTEIIDDCKAQTLIPIILGKVDFKSVINTDSWKSYDGLVAVGYDKHFRVNHCKNEFVFKGESGAIIIVNGIEGFWSFTKRRLAKFNGTKINFKLHLKECEWRFNHSQPNKTQSKLNQEKYLFDLNSDLWLLFKQYLRFLKYNN